jgi:hypothetical protein
MNCCQLETIGEEERKSHKNETGLNKLPFIFTHL